MAPNICNADIVAYDAISNSGAIDSARLWPYAGALDFADQPADQDFPDKIHLRVTLRDEWVGHAHASPIPSRTPLRLQLVDFLVAKRTVT
jgi:hypothetical protein